MVLLYLVCQWPACFKNALWTKRCSLSLLCLQFDFLKNIQSPGFHTIYIKFHTIPTISYNTYLISGSIYYRGYIMRTSICNPTYSTRLDPTVQWGASPSDCRLSTTTDYCNRLDLSVQRVVHHHVGWLTLTALQNMQCMTSLLLMYQ